MALANATMRAVIWGGIPYNMSVQTVPIPQIQAPTDALVRLTSSAICGTDLHTYHGIYGSPTAPWNMGHEGLGIIEEIGTGVSSLAVGDYVIIPDAVSDGHLDIGPPETSSFGLGSSYGDFGGTQAEYARVPFADESLIPIPVNASANGTLPNEIDYLFVSDIFATAWTGVTWSGFEAGDTIAIFGAGPVGLLAAYSSILRGASRVYIVDHETDRLALGESIGAVPINFIENDPVQRILQLEPDGVTRAVDCVGFEAVNRNLTHQENTIVESMIAVTASKGGIATLGVFDSPTNSSGTPLGNTITPTISFPIADFFNKGLRWQAGPVDPKLIATELVNLIASGRARPSFIVSSEIGIEQVPEYYRRFDQHLETKVVIRFPQ